MSHNIKRSAHRDFWVFEGFEHRLMELKQSGESGITRRAPITEFEWRLWQTTDYQKGVDRVVKNVLSLDYRALGQ